MKKDISVISMAFLLAYVPIWFGATSAMAADKYDFEHLPENQFLDMYDGWVDQEGQGDTLIRRDVTTNHTIVAYHLSTVAFDESAFSTRTNDENYSFTSFTGSETNAVIEFEANGDAVSWFGLGHDVNGNGVLDVYWDGKSAAGELGPAFGTNHIWIGDDRKFALQTCDGTLLESIFNSGDNGLDSYRIQLRIDFTANGGDGSGSLYYMNLTNGDWQFQSVTGIQDVNLHLSQMNAGAAVENWDAMWLHLRTVGSGHPFADNLVPNAAIIEEICDYSNKQECGSDANCAWIGNGKSGYCTDS